MNKARLKLIGDDNDTSMLRVYLTWDDTKHTFMLGAIHEDMLALWLDLTCNTVRQIIKSGEWIELEPIELTSDSRQFLADEFGV